MQQLKEKQEILLEKRESESMDQNNFSSTNKRESRLDTKTNKSENDTLNQSQRTIGNYDSLLKVNNELNDELNKLGERLTFFASDASDQNNDEDSSSEEDNEADH